MSLSQDFSTGTSRLDCGCVESSWCDFERTENKYNSVDTPLFSSSSLLFSHSSFSLSPLQKNCYSSCLFEVNKKRDWEDLFKRVTDKKTYTGQKAEMHLPQALDSSLEARQLGYGGRLVLSTIFLIFFSNTIPSHPFFLSITFQTLNIWIWIFGNQDAINVKIFKLSPCAPHIN